MIERTLLRRIVSDNGEEWFCIIYHNLEQFRLEVSSSWKIKEDDNLATFLVQKDVQYPSYITTKHMYPYENNLLNTSIEVYDKNNVFSLLEKAFLKKDIYDFLIENEGFQLKFNRATNALYFSSCGENSKRFSLLEPVLAWEGGSKDLVYNIKRTDNPLLNYFLDDYTCNDKFILVGKQMLGLDYTVFRTVWYDIIIQNMYFSLALEAMNNIGKILAKWGNNDIFIYDSIIEPSVIDIAIIKDFNEYSENFYDVASVAEFYGRLNAIEDSNIGFTEIYRTALKSLDFTTPTEVVWDSFYDVYRKTLTEFALSFLYYMRWRVICDNTNISSAFQTPLQIDLTFGTLFIKGGTPRWEKI